MDRDLYRIMKEIQEKEQGYSMEKGKFTVEDVEYVGKVKVTEKINDVDVEIEKDIFKVIEIMEDGTIIENYYDEKSNFIAGRGKDGKLYPSISELNKTENLLEQIDEISKEQGITLTELDEELEAIAKKLGIEKEEVLAMTEINLGQEIKENEQNKEDKKLDLNEEKEEQNKEQNKSTLDNIASKQEIRLDRKVDTKHTLGDVLGIDSSAKLVAVYSENIKDNENTTRFSFIIKKADGTLENADMLNQVGGKTSDKNVYEMNRDGSEIEKQHVQSSYAINSPIIRDGVLTAKIGEMGYIEVGYGQLDRTSHKDVLTQELETERTYSTTYKVREEFDKKNGMDNIKEDLDEIKEHEKYGCDDITLDEADGNIATGHKHIEITDEMIKEVRNSSELIDESYTDREIEAYIERMHEKHDEEDIDKIIELAKEELDDDAKHMHLHRREHPEE